MTDGAAQRLAAMQAALAQDSEAFWLTEATRRLDWSKAPTRADDSSFHQADFGVRWFADGEINLSVNCLDRHLATRGDQTAIVFEGDEPGEGRRISYRELYEDVCRFANLLKAQGVGKKEATPFLLKRVVELSGGQSLEANVALIKNNAMLAAQAAVELMKVS